MTSRMNGARRRTLATRLAGAYARQDTFSNACTLAILVIASAPALASAAAPKVPTASAPPSGVAFQAATAAVSNCNDTGAGSLRLAVGTAASGGVVDMTMLSCSLITLTTGAILIDHAVANLTLLGPTDHDLEIKGNGLGRVLVHNGEGTLLLDHLAVTNGSYTSGYYGGGCIYAFGSVVLQHSRVSDCTLHLPSYDAPGGGIYAKVDLTMTSSVLSGNSAIASTGSAFGGGAFVGRNLVANSSSVYGNHVSGPSGKAANGGGFMVSGTAQLSGTTLSANQARRGGGICVVKNATIVNSTLSGNAASSNQGGGIWGDGVTAIDNSTVAFNAGVGVYIYGALAINSSIVARNLVAPNSQDVSATCAVCQSLPSGSHNLMTGSSNFVLVGTITQDPKLAPLADNGGSTLTHALKIGSPAIDTGAVNFSLDFDQRFDGHPRVIGSAADIGAFELDTIDVIFFDGFE